MSKLRHAILILPEYLLIVAVLFYWSSAGLIINPIAIGLIIALVLQIIFKNQVVGILIPCLLILTCLYMLMALISEFSEFPTFNSEAKTLLFVGLTYFISTMVISGIMIYKYTIMETKNNKKSSLSA